MHVKRVEHRTGAPSDERNDERNDERKAERNGDSEKRRPSDNRLSVDCVVFGSPFARRLARRLARPFARRFARSSLPSRSPSALVLALPELPDISIYVEALNRRVKGAELVDVKLRSPFLLRSVEPPIDVVKGKTVLGVRRLGKRIVFELEDELYLVLHLMIAGRLKWREAGKKPTSKVDLAAFELSTGTLLLTEAGSKRRASLHIVAGAAGLAAFDRGGLEVLEATLAQFAERLTSESHTVKRALTDPRLFSGIGNAYSDEILHRARLSPVKLTRKIRQGTAPMRPERTLMCGKASRPRSMSEPSAATMSRARGPATVTVAHCDVTSVPIARQSVH